MTASKKQKALAQSTKYVPPEQKRPIYQRASEIESEGGKIIQRQTFLTIREGTAPVKDIRSETNAPILNDPPSGDQTITESTPVSKTSKRKRAPAAEAMDAWLPNRESYLRQLICLEGRSDISQKCCRSCTTNTDRPTAAGFPYLECLDCFNRELQCLACILRDHENLPLHRIREWNGRYFQRKTLKSLGLRIQLGHRRGERCALPEQCHADDFVIVDVTGIHSVGLDFCGCGKTEQTRVQQLLLARLFPATVSQPKTAVRLQILQLYEILAYESKVSALEFYQTLTRLTDNTNTRVAKDRYAVFLRVIHQWRHLHMMKRSGRGHALDGILGTDLGECALRCPACPHDGINLLPGWENAPEHEKFLYALFVSLDANFRLKRKTISNEAADPGLNHGYAYVVEEKAYKAHLENYKTEEEPKTSCSRHDAILLSDAKPSRGHAATGVGSVMCSRHEMRLPCSIGDLQRGERYCNMDYIFLQSLRNRALRILVASYDIACQWRKTFRARIEAFDPSCSVLKDEVEVTYLVPKFHLPAHIEACRTRFSFNFTPGVGRTDGEGIERGWSETNALATSTREMGPGTRRDTLDFHFGDYNWRKIIALGIFLYWRLWNNAISMAEQVITHCQFQSTIASESLQKWEAEISAWEAAPDKHPNPLVVTAKGPTQAAVRLHLAEEEAKALAAGKDFSLDDKITPSVLISSGMDLEAEQRSVKGDMTKIWSHSKDRQRTQLQLRQNALGRKIDAWTKFQLLYMPAVAVLRHNHEQDAIAKNLPEQQPSDRPLWLPSQVKNQIEYDSKLAEIEWKMREAQAYEALDRMCRNLQIRTHLLRFKKKHVRGQGASTRARNAIATIQGHIDDAAGEYRVAHTALVSLAAVLKKSGWSQDLQVLHATDVRAMSEGEEGQSEGKRKVSWIWRSMNTSENIEANPELKESVKIEWCKSRGRARGFVQEVNLLLEEMKRVKLFFGWMEKEWMSRADASNLTHVTDPQHLEALQAYAFRQANVFKSLLAHVELLWKDLPGHVELMRKAVGNPELLEKFYETEYEIDVKGTRKRKKRKRVGRFDRIFEGDNSDTSEDSDSGSEDDIKA